MCTTEVNFHVGQETPLDEGHRVTIKQLMDWQVLNREHVSEDANHVPEVIQRAVPGLDAAKFEFLKDRTHFLLSWAYVQQKPALQLLRNSLEVVPILNDFGPHVSASLTATCMPSIHIRPTRHQSPMSSLANRCSLRLCAYL